jgi:azurin
MRQLRTQVKEPVLPSDPAVLVTYVAKLSDKDLAGAPDVEPVLAERIGRKATDAAKRDEALTKLAALRKTDKTTEIVSALQRIESSGGSAADDLAKTLTTSTAADLTKARAPLSLLATSAKVKAVRRAAVAALIVADANPAATWSAAASDDAKLTVIESLATVSDPTLRAKFQPLLVTNLTSQNALLRSATLRALPLTGAEMRRPTSPSSPAPFAMARNASRHHGRSCNCLAIRGIKPLLSPVAESILAWAKTVPPDSRTQQYYIEVTQAGTELAGLLPPTDAMRIRKELRGLGVSVFVLHTVHEQMRYDQARLVVEAGKPFEIILENADTMPHNLVFVKPASHEKVGMASATMTPDKLDKQGRAFIPKSDLILDATKLVEPAQKDSIKVSGINDEGEFEYVCTVPGHFALMWGKLIVTKDVDAYLQANPVALQSAPNAPAIVHQH